MFSHFKNDSIRKLVVAFGSLFNNIKLEQKDENNNSRLITVPLNYASKEKFVKRLTEPSSISDKTRIQISLPRMSFELGNFAYDFNRRLNKTLQRSKYNSATDTTSVMYNEAPYNFSFFLNVYTRNLEENLQIMEQFLPYFSPEFVVSIKMNDLHPSVDVPISIVQSNLTQEYEGDFSTRRFLVSNYQFVAKSYVYGPVSTGYRVDEFDFTMYGQTITKGLTLAEFGITG
jgi:hypothetical protein